MQNKDLLSQSLYRSAVRAAPLTIVLPTRCTFPALSILIPQYTLVLPVIAATD